MAKGGRCQSIISTVEVREMRSADQCLSIIRTRGERRLPMDDLYRQLFNPEFYLKAYGKIYRNHGAMTPGTTPETVDGMSLTKIQDIIDALRFERYRWSPVRRTYIPKKKGKLRPLGMPTWSDKLLQEVVRRLLEAYYEPQFSDRSHGFRSSRDVIPPCERSTTTGGERSGSSKGTFAAVSTTWTTPSGSPQGGTGTSAFVRPA
jgi:retron-type reverse transcriptase